MNESMAPVHAERYLLETADLFSFVEYFGTSAMRIGGFDNGKKMPE